MPDYGAGVFSEMGIGIESTPGTEVAVDERLPLLSESLQHQFAQIPDMVLQNLAGRRQPERGLFTLTGDVTCEWTYDDEDVADRSGVDTLIAVALGSVAFSSNTNTHTMAENPATTFTLAYNKFGDTASTYNDIWVFDGCLIDRLVIAGRVGEKCTLTFTPTTMGLSRSSGTNTTAVLDGLLASPTTVMFDDLTFRVDEASGTNLVAADDFYPMAFTLTVDNALATDLYTNQQLQPILARRGGPRSVTLDLEFPVYEGTGATDATSIDWWVDREGADDELMMTIEATDGGTDIQTILMPNLHVAQTSVPIPGEGILTSTINLTAHRKKTTTASFFSASSEELMITTVDGRTAAPF